MRTEKTEKLMHNAAIHLEQFKTVLMTTHEHDAIVQALNSVTDFLKSSDYGFFKSDKSQEEEVSAAMIKLSIAFKNKLSQSHSRDLDIVMQAAVELKWTIHESWLATARRKGGCAWHLVDPVALVTKGVSLPVSDWIEFGECMKNQETHRKSLFKSVYEGILAEKLGVIESDCLCNDNHCSEKSAFKKAMLMHYDATGHLICYNDISANDVLFSSSAYTLSSLSQTTHQAANDKVKEVKLRVSASSIASLIEYKSRPFETRFALLEGHKKTQHSLGFLRI